MSLELRWSKEKPVKEGWYWVMEPNSKFPRPPAIVEINRIGSTWFAVSTKANFARFQQLTDSMEFAGPIEPPREFPPESELPTLEDVQAIYRQHR